MNQKNSLNELLKWFFRIFAVLVLSSCNFDMGMETEIIGHDEFGQYYTDFSYTIQIRETAGDCGLKNIRVDVETGECDVTVIDGETFQHCGFLFYSHNLGKLGVGETKKKTLTIEVNSIIDYINILTEEKVRYKTDDIFVFITDGVNEARNAVQEEFEEQRVCDIVFENHKQNATEIKNAILHNIKNFVGNENQHDDLTMVVIKAK